MNIGLDAHAAFDGDLLRNYSRYVINNLSHIHYEHQYRLYTPDISAEHHMDSITERENVAVVLPLKSIDRTFSDRWRKRTLIRDLVRDRVELYHGLCGELPPELGSKGIRSVVTIPNLHIFYQPGFYSAFERSRFMRKLSQTCEAADHIVTLSNYTKQYIVTNVGIALDKVSVVYQGCDSVFMNIAADEDRERVRQIYSLPETFVLSAGEIDADSNLSTALSALFHLDSSVQLVVIGRETPYAGRLKEFAAANGLASRLHLRHVIAHEDLPAVYQAAVAFIYLSACEGMGLPIIEAMFAGLPVVTAGGASLMEAGGEAVVYVSYTDDHAISQAVSDIMNFKVRERSKVVMAGKRQALRFGDNRLAWELMSVYEKVMNQ
ncbi:MAG: glycosyltransferase family 4 protein [Tannerellaceae bacterium]|jgi:glycosyltransferase involved in cell wall biosynthesis|nr:glycosyltransferase family 4 protein [Tannerellaceae bacterium]